MTSIDVAIPNYNYGRYLRACIESVLRQDVRALRVLIIDNASTDDSCEVAQQLVAEDSRVALIRHPSNLGHHASFNEAIDWAASDAFMILCADDLLTEGSLARALSVLQHEPAVTFAFGELAPGQPAPGTGRSGTAEANWQFMPATELLEHCCRSGLFLVRSCSAVVRTEAQKRAGHYCTALDQSDDFELIMRLTLQGGLVARTRLPQLFMRDHEGERSAVVRRERRLQILAYEAAFEWFFSHEGAAHPQAQRLASLAARGLLGRAYWSGLSHLCRGDLRNAAGLFGYVAARSWSATMLPPFDYLPNRRIATGQDDIVSGAIRRLLPARWV
ncbi:glycosyltransferase family 2 protein [Kaistia adipata]|uniref:glycosyltransferase family 2 protein n=1 Tax=Kaistia adipata TaxID=166954 RepID=UPI00041C1840|nr:glycosyltransferase family 2 protein [Kaistia adipata]